MIIDAPKLSDLPALRALWREAFGDSEEFLDAFVKTAFSLDRCRCVKVDGAVVAVLYWFDCSYQEERVAYLYAIATAKACRGRGYCSALLRNTHQHLTKLGYVAALLVPATKDLFAFYQKNGYQISGNIGALRCVCATEDVEIRQIDASEYAKLRRKKLPPNGIIQELENLDFLQTQAQFYAGEDFLLAARREKDTLYGLELLGDTFLAPEIVKALHCREGSFRMPGNDMPFSMVHSLKEREMKLPLYFGLALD